MTDTDDQVAQATKMAEALARVQEEFRAEGLPEYAERMQRAAANLPYASLARLYNIIREA
jgi:hypothetical protein